jgi:hypothetical protein
MPPFCFRLGLTASVGYSVYQSQIATATVLVETAVQKQVNNKIQEATFFIKVNAGGNPFCKESKMSYHIVAGAFREEANADKIFKRLSDQGYNQTHRC